MVQNNAQSARAFRLTSQQSHQGSAVVAVTRLSGSEAPRLERGIDKDGITCHAHKHTFNHNTPSAPAVSCPLGYGSNIQIFCLGHNTTYLPNTQPHLCPCTHT